MKEQYEIVKALGLDEAPYNMFLAKIKAANEKMAIHIKNTLLSNGNLGVRTDVLQYISENIEAFPKKNADGFAVFDLIFNCELSPEYWEIIVKWMRDKNYDEDTEDDLSEFVIVFSSAIEMQIPYEVICDYFADTNVNLMELYGKIGEYDANKMVSHEAEMPLDEKNVSSEIEMVEKEAIKTLEESANQREHIKVEVTSEKKEESSQIALFDSFVKAMSLKNKDMSNLYEAQDHINKLVAQCQLILTETLTYTTEIIRQWEADKDKIEQMAAFQEIQKKFFLEQQNKMNDMRNRIVVLETQIAEAEKSLQKRDEINKKAQELMEMTTPVSHPNKINYPYVNTY